MKTLILIHVYAVRTFFNVNLANVFRTPGESKKCLES